MPAEMTLANIFDYFQDSISLNADGEAILFTPKQDGDLKTKVKFFLAGAMAGAFSRTVTAPLDRLRVLLQISSESPTSSKRLINAIRQLYQTGGLKAFFRGNAVSVIKIAPESAFKYGIFEMFKKSRKSGQPQDISTKLLSGGVSGMVAQSLIYPMELVKTRWMSTSKGQYTLLGLCQSIYREGGRGIKGFYRGLYPALLGIFPFAAIDLALFDTLKMKFGKGKNIGTGYVLCCGMFSGMTASICVYPIGLVRTRHFFSFFLDY